MVAGLLVVGTQPAWAARTQVHDAAESMEYGRKFGGMIGRGALNVVTSPIDVIVNVVNDTKAGPPLVGTLTGVAKGLGCGVLRLGSGAVDLVTFWVPGFNGFPVSDSYDNCLAGTGASSASMEQTLPPGYSQSSWEPAPATAESGPVQIVPPTAGEPSPAPKKSWKK
jgi:putative exosortase-associated protein (TIGR04073 family)